VGPSSRRVTSGVGRAAALLRARIEPVRNGGRSPIGASSHQKGPPAVGRGLANPIGRRARRNLDPGPFHARDAHAASQRRARHPTPVNLMTPAPYEGPGPRYPLDVVLPYHQYPGSTGGDGGGHERTGAVSFGDVTGVAACPFRRGLTTPSWVVSSRGIFALPGGRGSGLPFDGASFEHESCTTATAARLALPGRPTTMRSPRPDVSPPCPEHGGLASLSLYRHFQSRDGDKPQRRWRP
jgi:hypothetical protein